jgi:hypothetical protein
MDRSTNTDTFQQTIVSNALGSASAGIVCRCLTHPLDTAKARLQALSAAQYNYRGPADILRQTFHKEGIRGLYRGFGAVIVGGTPGTILYLCSYDISVAVARTFFRQGSFYQSPFLWIDCGNDCLRCLCAC